MWVPAGQDTAQAPERMREGVVVLETRAPDACSAVLEGFCASWVAPCTSVCMHLSVLSCMLNPLPVTDTTQASDTCSVAGVRLQSPPPHLSVCNMGGSVTGQQRPLQSQKPVQHILTVP